MPTTEILVCPLKAGSAIGDDQNEAAKVLKEVGSRLKSTDGVQSIQFGMQIENPDVFQLLVSKFSSCVKLRPGFEERPCLDFHRMNSLLRRPPPPCAESDSGE